MPFVEFEPAYGELSVVLVEVFHVVSEGARVLPVPAVPVEDALVVEHVRYDGEGCDALEELHGVLHYFPLLVLHEVA